jgi:hypothetical protein
MKKRLLPHEAWDRAIESMLDDEAERISKMTPEELDADLRAKGVDPVRLRAKGAAFAARFAARKASKE